MAKENKNRNNHTAKVHPGEGHSPQSGRTPEKEVVTGKKKRSRQAGIMIPHTEENERGTKMNIPLRRRLQMLWKKLQVWLT